MSTMRVASIACAAIVYATTPDEKRTVQNALLFCDLRTKIMQQHTSPVDVLPKTVSELLGSGNEEDNRDLNKRCDHYAEIAKTKNLMPKYENYSVLQ